MQKQGLSVDSMKKVKATILQKAGVSLKEAQIWLGHSSISVTIDIYTHIENNFSAADKLNKFLGVN
ncbi:MAG: hypothetical protein PWP27_2446 [Clostridiales bacterium]|jgi:site-specific recombinase XerD|nr:hypothetical protein [Clostridiales bacterium]MDK2934636.1 hypothetical protein [Clostridiales bacterium]